MNRSTRIGVVLTSAVAILAPLLLGVWQSFLDGPFFARNVHPTLGAYQLVFEDPDFYRALGNSVLVAAGMACIAVPVGALLAFLLVRTDLPGRRWVEPLLLTPMFISSIVLAFGFVVAFGPVGIVSLWVKGWLGWLPWDIYSPSSLILH